jgi:hypothetical protein
MPYGVFLVIQNNRRRKPMSKERGFKPGSRQDLGCARPASCKLWPQQVQVLVAMVGTRTGLPSGGMVENKFSAVMVFKAMLNKVTMDSKEVSTLDQGFDRFVHGKQKFSTMNMNKNQDPI